VPDDLLATAIEAAGGQKLWNTLRSLTVHFSSGGPLWAMKGWPPSATFDQTVTLNTVDDRIKCTMILAGAQSRAGLSVGRAFVAHTAADCDNVRRTRIISQISQIGGRSEEPADGTALASPLWNFRIE
jgi:hypothetical protein